MSRLPGLLACLVLGACVLAGAHPITMAQDTGPPPDFAGKFLLIESQPGGGTTLLSEARLRALGPRHYLVGKCVSQYGDRRVWILLDTVTRITEFDKLEDASQVIKVPQ